MLVSDGSLSFVIFLYADGGIQWPTGLRGTPALAGVNAGDGDRHFSVSGSLTDDIINISTTSNIGVKGVWIFQVNGELSRAPIDGILLCSMLFSTISSQTICDFGLCISSLFYATHICTV